MLEAILGSTSAEQVLIFIQARGSGYAREIARFFETDLLGIQNLLEKLEAAGVLVSRSVGRTRPFEFNPRYPILLELKALLTKALDFYPEPLRERLLLSRLRLRRSGKTS